MVYSSAPARVSYTGEVETLVDDDTFSCKTSSDGSKSTLEALEPDTNMRWKQNFEPFVHRNQTNEGEEEEFNDPFNFEDLVHEKQIKKTRKLDSGDKIHGPKSNVVVHPKRPEESCHREYKQDKEGEGMACHSRCMSSLSRLAPWGCLYRRARVEMLQHQLGKPLRALSCGKRITTRTGAFNCFKNTDVDEVPKSDDGTKSPTPTQHSVTLSSSEPSLGNQREPAKAKPIQEIRRSQSDDAWEVAEGFGGKDFRWLYSCNFWPTERSTSMDPPGHYYKTEQEVQFHFYNDFSVEMSQKNEPAAKESAPALSTNPTSEMSDDESFFVLQDDLD